MWVAASQKPMQSFSVLPPPPGALGADSLGLAEEEPGDRASVLVVVPPVENCSGSWGESGAMSGTRSIGGAMAEGGNVGGETVALLTPEDTPAEAELPEEPDEPPEPE
jgi:hypothetical protein